MNQTALPSNVFLFPCISYSGRVEQRIPLFAEHRTPLPQCEPHDSHAQGSPALFKQARLGRDLDSSSGRRGPLHAHARRDGGSSSLEHLHPRGLPHGLDPFLALAELWASPPRLLASELLPLAELRAGAPIAPVPHQRARRAGQGPRGPHARDLHARDLHARDLHAGTGRQRARGHGRGGVLDLAGDAAAASPGVGAGERYGRCERCERLDGLDGLAGPGGRKGGGRRDGAAGKPAQEEPAGPQRAATPHARLLRRRSGHDARFLPRSVDPTLR